MKSGYRDSDPTDRLRGEIETLKTELERLKSEGPKPRWRAIVIFVGLAALLPPAALFVWAGLTCGMYAALVHMLPTEGAWAVAGTTAFMSVVLSGFATVHVIERRGN